MLAAVATGGARRSKIETKSNCLIFCCSSYFKKGQNKRTCTTIEPQLTFVY